MFSHGPPFGETSPFSGERNGGQFSDVVREMEARFRAEQREREACHREVMDGLVIPPAPGWVGGRRGA